MFKIFLYIALFGVLVLFGLALYVVIKPYATKRDCVTLYTGGNGSGKSFFAVRDAIVDLRKNRLKVFFKNINPVRRIIKRQPKIPKPLLISNIPIRVGFREMSVKLDTDLLLLKKRVPQLSIVFIDEVNLFLSQMDYKIKSEKVLNEFCTLYRHQSLGGSLYLTTQSVNKIHWIFRYTANRSYNLCEFRKPILGLPILAWVKCRNVSIGDDIKMVEDDNLEDGYRNLFALFPLRRKYDTYVYSNRYSNLEPYHNVNYNILKRNSLMHLDKEEEYSPLLNDED